MLTDACCTFSQPAFPPQSFRRVERDPEPRGKDKLLNLHCQSIKLALIGAGSVRFIAVYLMSEATERSISRTSVASA